MYKLIFSTIKRKKGIFAGTFISIVLAMMLLTICLNLMFSSIAGLRSVGGNGYVGSISIFGTLSGITIFAAIFVIVGTASFSIQQRYGDIALLRGVGLTPRQIRRMLSAEMNFFAILGFLLGAPLGLLTTPILLNRFISLGAVPPNFAYNATALNLLMVFGIGFIVLHIAAFFSAKRIVDISPTEAMRESTIRIKSAGLGKLITGLTFVLGAIAILIFVPQHGAAGIGYNFLASLCFIIGTAVLGEYIVKAISWIIRMFFKLFGATGKLANENSKRYTYRMSNAALGIVLIIALNGGILINSLAFNENMAKDAAAYYDDKTELYSAEGFSVEQLKDIQSNFDEDIYNVFVESEVEHYGLNGNKYKYDDYDVVGVLGGYEANEVSVSEKFAEQFEVSVGDEIEVLFDSEYEEEVIVKNIHNRNDVGKADFIMNYELVHKYDSRAVIQKIIFSVGEAEITDELDALTSNWSELAVNPAQGSNAQQDANLKTQNAVIYSMIFISLAFSIIAVINTFFITIASRKAEYRDLWLIGITEKQIKKMLNLESAIIILSGILLGAIINSACISTFNRANGYSSSIIGNPQIYFGLIGVALLIGLLASRISAVGEVSKSVGRVRYE